MSRRWGGMSICWAGGLGERVSGGGEGREEESGCGICAGLFPTDSTLSIGIDSTAGNGGGEGGRGSQRATAGGRPAREE